MKTPFVAANGALIPSLGFGTYGMQGPALSNIIPVGFRIATQLPIIGGLCCYVLSVVVWIVGLSRVDVSIAYPMLSLGYVVNAFAAWYLFGEALSAQRLIGIGVILVGVVVVARS